MNHPASAFYELARREMPPAGPRGDVPFTDSVVADLYAVISILDSASQSDLAGRLHALTLEIRERATKMNARQYS